MFYIQGIVITFIKMIYLLFALFLLTIVQTKTASQSIFYQYAIVNWESKFGVTSFSFSDDLSLMLVTTDTPTDPFLVYFRQNETYSILHKGYCDCPDTSVTLTNAFISSDGSQAVASYSDNVVRIYSLTLYNITISQSISLSSVTAPPRLVYATSGYIVAYDTMKLQAYKLQLSKGIYSYSSYSVTTVEDPSLSNSVVAISSDGQFIVTGANLERGPYSFMINTYANSKSGFAYSTQQQVVSPKDINLPGGIQKILISGPVSGTSTYFVIAMAYSESSYFIKFYKLKDTTLTWTQDIVSSSPLSYAGCYLTANGQYLSITLADRKMSLYQYDTNSDTFLLSLQVWSFYSVPDSAFMEENAQLAAGAISTSQGMVKDQIVFYVACSVTNCLQCSWPGQCAVCSPNYSLNSSFQCVCSTNFTTLPNGTCLNCSISHCSECSVQNYCSLCSDGYTVSFGACICPSAFNVSLLDGHCVSCNVANCYRCDKADVCSVLQLSSSGSLTTISSGTGQSCNCSEYKAIFFIILVLTLILVILFAILVYKMCALHSRINKVGDSSNKEQRKRSARIKEETGFTLLDQTQQRNPLDSLKSSAYTTPQNSAKIQESGYVLKPQQVEYEQEDRPVAQDKKLKVRKPKSPPPPCDRFLKRMARFAGRQTFGEGFEVPQQKKLERSQQYYYEGGEQQEQVKDCQQS